MDSLICSVLEFTGNLVLQASFHNLLLPQLPGFIFYSLYYMQMTNEEVGSWMDFLKSPFPSPFSFYFLFCFAYAVESLNFSHLGFVPKNPIYRWSELLVLVGWNLLKVCTKLVQALLQVVFPSVHVLWFVRWPLDICHKEEFNRTMKICILFDYMATSGVFQLFSCASPSDCRLDGRSQHLCGRRGWGNTCVLCATGCQGFTHGKGLLVRRRNCTTGHYFTWKGLGPERIIIIIRT